MTNAQECVSGELRRLEAATDKCLASMDAEFSDILSNLEKRRLELQSSVTGAAREKKRVLEEQMSLIEAEKNKVEQECEGLQYQVEVRNITRKIGSLSDQLDAAVALNEPRENAFITVEFNHNEALAQLECILKALGRIRSSTTLPGLCRARLREPAIAKLQTTVIVETIDYHGHPRNTGGDPIDAVLTFAESSGHHNTCNFLETTIRDLQNGTYEVLFRLPSASRYVLKLSVFERNIKDCPMYLTASEHNEPLKIYGKQGQGKDEFYQPTAIAIDENEMIYIVDTGNSRIKVCVVNF